MPPASPYPNSPLRAIRIARRGLSFPKIYASTVGSHPAAPILCACFPCYLGMEGIPGILGMRPIIRPILEPVTIFIILRVWSNCLTKRFTS